MKKLTTAAGTNIKANIWTVAGIVAPMIATFPEGWMKWVAFETFVIFMAVTNWRIQGNIPPDVAEEIVAEKEIEDVLREGRE